MSNQKIKGNLNLKRTVELPSIPEKFYFTIGEVSKLCLLKPHVLRYWEQEFMQLSPVKRRGNRRYYQLKDVLTIRRIRQLLYEEGYTIEGARQKLLRENNLQDPIYKVSYAVRHAVDELEKVIKELR